MKGCWLSCVGGAHLSVGVSVVLLCPGLVVLLYESKVFLPLALKDQLSALPVGRQVTLGGGGGGDRSLHLNRNGGGTEEAGDGD